MSVFLNLVVGFLDFFHFPSHSLTLVLEHKAPGDVVARMLRLQLMRRHIEIVDLSFRACTGSPFWRERDLQTRLNNVPQLLIVLGNLNSEVYCIFFDFFHSGLEVGVQDLLHDLVPLSVCILESL